MFTPTDKTLTCHAIQGLEGIGKTYVANITFTQFCEYFDIADVQDEEENKLQRDPTKARAKGVSDYLTGRENTVFPEVICVATKLNAAPIEGINSLNGVSQLVTLTLEADAQRMLVDGQGRRLGVAEAINIAKQLAMRTIDIKFVQAPTGTLIASKTFIRQIFADLHRKVQKPNSSINLFFDASEVSAVFAVTAYEHLVNQGMPIDKLVSLDGNTRRVWTLAQFGTFLSAFTGMTAKEMNNVLSEANNAALYLDLLTGLMHEVLAAPVFNSLDSTEAIKEAKKQHLLCCAIGIESLGHMGRVVLDNAIAQQVKVDWSVIKKLVAINFDKKNKSWLGNVVDKHGKMIKGSAPKMAALIASELRIPLTSHLINHMAA